LNIDEIDIFEISLSVKLSSPGRSKKELWQVARYLCPAEVFVWLFLQGKQIKTCEKKTLCQDQRSENSNSACITMLRFSSCRMPLLKKKNIRLGDRLDRASEDWSYLGDIVSS